MPVEPSKTKQQTKVVVLWDKFLFLMDCFISWFKDYPDKCCKLFSDSSQAARWEGRQRVTNNQSKKALYAEAAAVIFTDERVPKYRQQFMADPAPFHAALEWHVVK